MKNPWPIIGGVASTIAMERIPDDVDNNRNSTENNGGGGFLRPEHARPGDLLVLTKPLGTQVAANCFEWLNDIRQTVRWSDVQIKLP